MCKTFALCYISKGGYNEIALEFMKKATITRNKNYRTVICEGGDQVGKADSILTFTKKMLEIGVPVTYASFPIYATPIGVCIRLFLRQGLPDSNLSYEESLKTKMALYALNRLEFMDILLSHSKYKNTIILLDRSPYSNAVTLAYGIANVENLKSPEKINELVEYALNLESFTIKTLHTETCVVQMVSETKSWNNVRNEKADINENQQVQEMSDRTYKLYAEKIGDGWRKIVTRTDSGWRDREEIFKDIYDFAEQKLGKISCGRKKMVNLVYEIGIAEILKSIYKGWELPEGLVTEHIKSIKENDKDTMHDTACIIGVQVGMSTKLVRIKHKAVREAMKKILQDNPGVFDVLEYFISKEFVTKFKAGVNGSESDSKKTSRGGRQDIS